ncbi:MAG: nucleotidyltransferase, partial [Cytophagales bacterium]
VPKNIDAISVVYFNKEAYSKHCKDFRQYQEWLDNRNTQRYIDTNIHNQKIDGKNLMHCRRLLDMAIEIATEKTIKVKRPNANQLLSIRKGEMSLDKIIEEAEIDIQKLEYLFQNSDLPDEIDAVFVNNLLLEVRHF